MAGGLSAVNQFRSEAIKRAESMGWVGLGPTYAWRRREPLTKPDRIVPCGLLITTHPPSPGKIRPNQPDACKSARATHIPALTLAVASGAPVATIGGALAVACEATGGGVGTASSLSVICFTANTRCSGNIISYTLLDTHECYNTTSHQCTHSTADTHGSHVVQARRLPCDRIRSNLRRVNCKLLI